MPRAVTKIIRNMFLCGECTSNDEIINNNNNNKYNDIKKLKKSDNNVLMTLEIEGYKLIKFLSKTLQGCIYIAKDIKHSKMVIIKISNKEMSKNGYTILNGKMIKISENFRKEAFIMKYLTHSSKKYPNDTLRFIKSKRFFSDINNYYLIQQFGGINMFKFVLDKHTLIKNNKTLIIHWKNSVKKYFCEIVNTLYWFHDVMSMCHLDISLENIVYNAFKDRVYICDFGLSQVFKNSHDNENKFIHNKYVGKFSYFSPNMVDKIPFDARKADIWALGVSLYLMNFGIPPFKYANIDDPYYRNIINGHLKTMLSDYGFDSYLDDTLVDLFYNIFTSEDERYTTKEIMKHEYTKGYQFSNFN